MPRTIVWKAYEHEHTEKTSDWFWALGIVAVSSAIVAVLFKNILFALLILIGSFTMALLASRPEKERTFSLTPRGIMIDETLFPYQMLVAFWVKERAGRDSVLIVDARKFMIPHIIVSLEHTDAEQVRAYLSEYLPEEELEEPLGQRILEKFGF
tara:strand:+ start:1294 stop:1755 length:462 start_codon:yes stop_codon:yes gene_type:complete